MRSITISRQHRSPSPSNVTGDLGVGGFSKGNFADGWVGFSRRLLSRVVFSRGFLPNLRADGEKNENAEARSQLSRKLVLTLAGIGVVGYPP